MAYSWESFIRIHGGEPGARSMFEKAMDELLRTENPDKEVHLVKAVQGDGGIDIFVYQDEGIDVYQCKFFMGSMNSSRWYQIKKSFNRAVEYMNSDKTKGVKMYRWFLCMPREMQKEDIAKWDKFKKDNEGVVVKLIDGNEIINRMENCDRQKGTHIIEHYFDASKKTEINEVLRNILKNSADNKAAMIKYTSERKFYSNNAHSRDLHPARLDASGGMLIREDCSPKLLPDEFPKIKPFIDDMNSEDFPSNLFEYVEQHIADKTDSRHIYLSATSGSGKTTCLYGLWDKYLIDDTKYIPIYVAMHEVKGSLKKYICGEYLSQGTTISDFDWLKSPDFIKTPYHILLLLDGYNEIAVNMDPEIDETIKEEIDDILGFERVTVVISSRDPIERFKTSIANLKLCPLAHDQIKILMGGHEEYLPEDKFEGILSNPFMLELCIKVFADDKNRFKSINEVSEEEIIREYLKKQIEGYKKEAGKERGLGIELSPLDIIYLDIVLPLAAMKLDERKNTSGDRKTIGTDPKEYRWNDFSNAVMSVQENFLTYRQLVKLIRPNTGGYNKKYTQC